MHGTYTRCRDTLVAGLQPCTAAVHFLAGIIQPVATHKPFCSFDAALEAAAHLTHWNL